MKFSYSWALATSSLGLHLHNPYHNFRHTQCVMNWACTMYMYENEGAPPDELVFAAAMHDYDHTGGREPDSANIALALHGVDHRRTHDALDDVDLDVVKDIVRATEFDGATKSFVIRDPYAMRDGAGFMAACVRDADLMAIYCDDAYTQLRGLYHEVLLRGPLSVDAFVKGNRGFLEKAPMFTLYGQRCKERYLKTALDRFETQVNEQFAAPL